MRCVESSSARLLLFRALIPRPAPGSACVQRVLKSRSKIASTNATVALRCFAADNTSAVGRYGSRDQGSLNIKRSDLVL
jgi:hypothetical protein